MRAMPVEDRFWTKVDKSGECWIWTGAKCGGERGGYGSIKVGPSTKKAHRVAWEMENGPIPEGMKLDHTCHTRACVRASHLRIVTHKQNLENVSGAYSTNKSGIRGVTWDAKTEKWAARVRHGGKLHHAGFHSSIDAARDAVTAVRLELFTHNDLDRKAS